MHVCMYVCICVYICVCWCVYIYILCPHKLISQFFVIVVNQDIILEERVSLLTISILDIGETFGIVLWIELSRIWRNRLEKAVVLRYSPRGSHTSFDQMFCNGQSEVQLKDISQDPIGIFSSKIQRHIIEKNLFHTHYQEESSFVDEHRVAKSGTKIFQG